MESSNGTEQSLETTNQEVVSNFFNNRIVNDSTIEHISLLQRTESNNNFSSPSKVPESTLNISSRIKSVREQNLLQLSNLQKQQQILEIGKYEHLVDKIRDNTSIQEETRERVKVLEEVAVHLNNQVKIMKRLVTAQINEIKNSFEQQMNEIRTIFMRQDQVFSNKFVEIQTELKGVAEHLIDVEKNQLEHEKANLEVQTASLNAIETNIHASSSAPEEVEQQLSNSIFQTPISKNKANFINNSNFLQKYLKKQLLEQSDILPPTDQSWISENKDKIVTPSFTPSFFPSPYDRRIDSRTIDQQRMNNDTQYVLKEVYNGNITTLFAFYCQYNTGSREKIVMNKSQFIKFIRDIQYMKINNVMKNTNYELTWIKVVKATYTSHSPSQKEINSKELSREDFDTALIILANDAFVSESLLTEAQKLENLIVNHIFPKISLKLNEFQKSVSLNGGLPFEVAAQTLSQSMILQSSSGDIDTSSIQKVFKKFQKDIKSSFVQYSQPLQFTPEPNNLKNRRISFKNLLIFMQRMGLLTHISKQELLGIHTKLALRDQENYTQDEELKLTFEKYQQCLLDISLYMYSKEPFASKVPSADAKLLKLLNKLFILEPHTKNKQ